VPAIELARRWLELGDAPARAQFLERQLGTFADEAVFRHLMAESERYLTIDPHAALLLAQAILGASERLDRPDRRAYGLMKAGDALRALGRYREALDTLEAAGRAFLDLGDEVGWARTCIGRLAATIYVGGAREALELAGPAERVLVRRREWLRAAGLVMHAAVLWRSLGRFDRALGRYRRALQHFQRATQADPAQANLAEIRSAKTKTNIAILLGVRGDFAAALTLFQEARAVYVRHGETLPALRLDWYVGDIYAGQGYYARALRLFGEATARLRRLGLDSDAAQVALSRAECELTLNRYREALALAEGAIRTFDQAGARTEASKARFFAGLAQARLGDVEYALVLLERAAASFAELGLAAYGGQATLQRAGLLLGRGEAQAAWQEAGRARADFRSRGLAVRQAEAEVLQGQAALALGRSDEASSLARAVLKAARAREVPWLAVQGRHLLGGVAQRRGRPRRALQEYDAAILEIERLQSRLVPALRTEFLEDKLSVFDDAIGCALRLGEPARAFAYLERAKSRALVDYLTAHPDVRLRTKNASNPELLAELSRLREEHDGLYNRLYGYGLDLLPETAAPGTAEADSGSAELRALRQALRDRERRIARTLDRLALESAGGPDALPDLLPARRFEPPALDEQTVLLAYYLTKTDAAVFVLGQGRLEMVPLDVRPADLARLQRVWQLNLNAAAQAVTERRPLDGLGRNARGILEAFYRALLQPVERFLAGCRRLVIVPHGAAHALPFQALHTGRHYLIEPLEVTTCPSSSLLEICAQRPRRPEASALVVAYGDGGRLPQAVAEARAIAALFPGECHVEDAATRVRVAAAAPRHGILHFAAHGEARLDNPNFAHLKLADGQLTTTDVFNLELEGALVTLSACETGRGLVRGGDELVGLSRGFLFAGASTLVQSLWRVEDGSAARLMTRFYTGLKAGRTKGAALHEAQRALLAERGEHPYFWAPFQLVGDYGPLLDGSPAPMAAAQRAPATQP
jgi:CHAT domain-containing protein